MKKIIELIKNFFKRKNVCLFLGSTDILPPPLSLEEETKYLLQSDKDFNTQKHPYYAEECKKTFFFSYVFSFFL